tara:strand:+ start:532 stop:933 length:402 start_codon:yes stop_codon:yes gene_type:complete
MIDSAGGIAPFLCHVFLILFGGFFSLNLVFNKNFVNNSIGYDSIQAVYMGRPLGFLMLGLVLMLIATLFQIGGFNSINELLGVLFIFCVLAFFYNLSLSLNILPTHDGQSHNIKNAIRPLIPLIVIIIRAFTI